MLLSKLKDLKARLKAIEKIKDPEKKRKALEELKVDLNGMRGLVGHVNDNLPRDLISDDMNKVLTGCLSSIKDDLGELEDDIDKVEGKLPGSKPKSSMFDFGWNFKMPDFSGLKFDWDKPSRDQVEQLVKDLPEPTEKELKQDLKLSFGKIRGGKDQDDVHRRLLMTLRMLLGRLKDLKGRKKAIEKIKDPEKKRKALEDFKIDLDGLEDLVGHVNSNLPRDLISDDMNKMLTGSLGSIKEDIDELQYDANKDFDKLQGSKPKSSMFDFGWKFKMPDFSGLKFDWDRPSREQVEDLVKDLPEPTDKEMKEDLKLSFGKVRGGKDQDDIHRRLLMTLRMLLSKLKDLKARKKAIDKIKDPEKKRKALEDFQIELNGLGDLVGHVGDNLPRDLISDDMNKVLTGSLASIKEDLAELQDDVNKDVGKLPSFEMPSASLGASFDSDKKKKDKKDKDSKSKSSMFDFGWKFKMPDFSGLKFDWDKPSREQVEDLVKELPEPTDKEKKQDLKLSFGNARDGKDQDCLLYTSPSPRDKRQSRMPSSA